MKDEKFVLISSLILHPSVSANAEKTTFTANDEVVGSSPTVQPNFIYAERSSEVRARKIRLFDFVADLNFSRRMPMELHRHLQVAGSNSAVLNSQNVAQSGRAVRKFFIQTLSPSFHLTFNIYQLSEFFSD